MGDMFACVRGHLPLTRSFDHLTTRSHSHVSCLLCSIPSDGKKLPYAPNNSWSTKSLHGLDCPKSSVIYPCRRTVGCVLDCPKHRSMYLSLGQPSKMRNLNPCPKEQDIDPMLRTFGVVPDWRTRWVNYPSLRTDRALHTQAV